MNAAAAARGYKMATAVEKIFSAKAGRPIKAGDIVVVEVDACMIHDVNGPTAVKNFAQIAKTVKSPAHHLIVLDHFAPCPNAAAGNNHLLLRRFAKEHGIRLVDVCKGVCHQKMLESGKVRPGGIAVGTDSHSCTYGALNAFSTGVGAAEAAVIFACDQCWFKVPPTIRVEFVGKLPRKILGKDLALELLRILGEAGASYQCMEFGGEAVADISFDSRATLCNMMIEAGAKGAIMPCDEVARRWLAAYGVTGEAGVEPDGDAEYSRRITIDVSQMRPLVAVPPRIDHAVAAEELEKVRVDQVVIGSCTNGRYEDIALAAEILRGKRVADGVRLLVYPASPEVEAALKAGGHLDALTSAGASVFPPSCGPCAGIHGGLLGDGEVAVSTTNRNLNGRMGSKDARIYIASPLVAACSALCGFITDREVLG